MDPWARLIVTLALCAASACAPTGGPGRPSWAAGAWPSQPDAAPALAAVPPEPARTGTPPQTLQPATAPIALSPAPAIPTGGTPVIDQPVYRFGGALLRTVEDDVINLPRDAPLVRRETGTGPAYCTGAGGAGTVTRSGREICLYDRDEDNLLDAFVILGASVPRFYDTGPFPFPRGES